MLSIFLLNSLNSWICLAIGSFANIFLLRLAQKYSRGELQEYRPVVNYFCGLNLLLLIFHAVNQPIFFISDELTAYIFVQGIVARIKSIPLRYSLAQFFLYLLIQEMTGLGWQFFGRYLALSRPNCGGKKCRRRALAIGNAIFFLVPTILGIFSTTIPPEEKFIGDLLFDGKNTSEAIGQEENLANSPKIAMQFDMQNSMLDQFMRIWMVFGLVLCYLSVVICYCRIRKFMQRHLMDNGNSRKRDMICQISRNMLLQACLPLCSLTICSFCILLMIFGYYSPKLLQMELLTFLQLNWLPVLNPLVTILTIWDYRIGATQELGQWGIGRERRANGSNQSGKNGEMDGEKMSLKNSN